MTPEERAAAVIGDNRGFTVGAGEPITLVTFVESALASRIADAIRAAEAAERAGWVRLARDHCVGCCEQIVRRAGLPHAQINPPGGAQ